jgi:hypothetical protein
MTVEERLKLLEDERAILHRLYAYGHAIDYGYEDEFVDCWIPTGVLYWPDPHPPYVGREAIREVFRRHSHAPQVFHKHLIAEPRIAIDGDRATADVMYTRLDHYPTGPEVSTYGRYRDVLVRCEDEQWRFLERRTEREATRPNEVVPVLVER